VERGFEPPSRRLKQWRTAIGSQHGERLVDNPESQAYIDGAMGE